MVKQPISFYNYTLFNIILTAMICLNGCLNVAEDRARLEDRIGSAVHDRLIVRSSDGLATIRSLSVNDDTADIELWAQVPQIKVSFNAAGREVPQQISLKIYNVMSGSTLTYTTGQNQMVVDTRYLAPTILEASLPFGLAGGQITLTPPQPDHDHPWRFALFADVQERLNGIADLLTPLGKENVHFALISGDLTSMGKVHELAEFQSQILIHLPFPCYATLGNHELGTSGIPFYRFFGRGTFSFVYGSARFSLLDGASATLAPQSKNKLDRWLDQAISQLHIVTTHIPLIDPDGTRGGAFASRLESAALLSDLQSHNVDLLLYGHVHTFRSFSQAGIPAIISGGGGSIPMRLDGIGRHYVLFEIDVTRKRISHYLQPIYPAN
jgi:3',5'-cyclic-AMP phosphodiesterase